MLRVENIVWKKNTVGGTRNDPFGYSKTSDIFRLISKYLLLASQTNLHVNIILQDFLYSFGWRRHWSQWKVSFSKSSHIFWRSIMNFCPRQFNDSKVFGVSAYELLNHEIKIWNHHNTCIWWREYLEVFYSGKHVTRFNHALYWTWWWMYMEERSERNNPPG